CSFTITLIDDIDPTITCPADFDVATDANCEFSIPDYTSLGTAADNCDADVTITQSPAVGNILSGEGTTQTITLTATDNAGNTSDCSFVITLIDNIDPQITCPGDQNEPVDANCEFSIPDYTSLATATDNCDAGVTVTQSPAAGNTLSGAGTTQTITLTATDNAGNTTTCTFDITLIDTIDPVITCPGDQTASADANCEFTMADYTGMVTATDNCDSSVDVVQSPAAGNIVSGTTTVTMTATDNVGNVSTCTFEVIVEDNAAPTIVDCQTDIDRSLNANCEYVLEDFTGAITATDNCTLDADLVYTQSPAAGTILNGVDAIHTITLTATDANGNSTDCSFDITLEDTTAPVIACPAGFNESTDANCEFTIPDYTSLATTSDNCDPGVVVTQSPAVGTVLSGEGTIQVIVLTATDASGNSSDCSFTITLIDDIDPTITCPADFDEATDANCEFSIPDYTSLGTATDNCDADVTITQSPAVGNVLSGEGTTQTITLTATDNAGNTSDCSFVITLIDDIDPQITCPGDQNEPTDVNCEFPIPDYTSLAVATDNCDAGVVVTQSPVAGTILSGEGTTQTITLTATDNAGNSTTCSFEITLIDTIDPVITCPADQTVSADANCEFTMADYTGMVTATDNCDSSVDVVQSPVAGDIVSGTTTVTMTATDNAGNVSTCTFDVIVVDNTDPVFDSCAPDVTEFVDASCEFALPDYTGLAVTSDNCDTDIEVTQSPAVGSVFSGHGNVIPVTLTATDDNGNFTTCTFDVTLEDNTVPSISCPASFDVDGDANCEFSIPDYTGMATVTDNCDSNPVVTQSPAVGTVLAGEGNVQVITLTATDAAGNESSCSFTITLIDVIAPSITCPGDIVENVNEFCVFEIPDYTGLATTADNCDSDVEVTQSPAVGTIISASGTVQEITLTATDNAGNQTSCTFDVTLDDVIAPTITCPANQTEEVDNACVFEIPDYSTLATIDDNCGTFTVDQTPAIGTEVTLGTHNITLTVTDPDGNSTDCTFQIEVIDAIDPVVTCIADITVQLDEDCGYEVEDFTAVTTVTDNCSSIFEVVQSPAAGTIITTDTVMTVTATDEAGNFSSCTFNITLQDTINPVITCPDNIVVTTDPGECGAVVDYELPVITDNCDDLTLELIAGLDPGEFFDQGVTTNTYLVTDGFGNTAECSFTVTVNDEEAPSIVCPPSIIVENDSSFCGAIVEYDLPIVDDNCGVDTLIMTEGIASGEFFPEGITLVEYEVTDIHGNTSVCSFTVRVDDTEAPIIEACPADIVMPNDTGDCGAIVTYDLPVATDNCTIDTIQVVSGPESGEYFEVGTTTVSYQVIDESGNSSFCEFTVTVEDTELPVITCPADIEVENDNGVCGAVVEYDLPEFSDNCEGSGIEITDGLESGEEFPVGETTVTYLVTDAAGNTSECSFTVTVLDTEAPVIECPEDIVQEEEVVIYDLPQFSDNCGAEITLIEGLASGEEFPHGYTTVTYEAVDEAGNATSCSFTVLVNTPPIAVDDEVNFYEEDDIIDIDALLNDWDPDDDDLTITSITAQHGDVGINPDGTIYYDPLDFCGDIDTLTYIACDPFNACDTAMIFVEVECYIDLIIPEGFSPNNDGVNDTFEILGLEDYPGHSIAIFNRWGRKVFEASPYNSDWDGRAMFGNTGDSELPKGTYFYLLDLGNGEAPVKGYIFLNK
ncbi:HYR domain-containing protein, partial [Halocola ammonii]